MRGTNPCTAVALVSARRELRPPRIGKQKPPRLLLLERKQGAEVLELFFVLGLAGQIVAFLRVPAKILPARVNPGTRTMNGTLVPMSNSVTLPHMKWSPG